MLWGCSATTAASVLPCTGGRTAERALGFVGLSHVGSGVCGPVSHGLWGLWACLTLALEFVGLSHIDWGLWACLTLTLGFVGLSHIDSGVCRPVSHGL